MQNALTIHPKVAASTIAGAVVVVVVYVLHQFAHIELPDEVAAALVVMLAGSAGWLAPPSAATSAAQIPAESPAPSK